MISYVLIFLIIAFVLWTSYLKTVNKNPIIIKKLLKLSTKWTNNAKTSEKLSDTVMYANYGAAYISAIRDIATEKEILDVVPNFSKYENDIYSTQQIVNKQINNQQQEEQ